MSIIIRRHTDHMNFYCFFHILLVLLYITAYTVVFFVCFCLILYNMYSYCYVYVFLLLCMFRSMYCVALCCSVYCLSVNVYFTTATGCQPKCSYQIYHIILKHVEQTNLFQDKKGKEKCAEKMMFILNLNIIHIPCNKHVIHIVSITANIHMFLYEYSHLKASKFLSVIF